MEFQRKAQQTKAISIKNGEVECKPQLRRRCFCTMAEPILDEIVYKGGFTLIELLVALGLWAILLSGIFAMQWHTSNVSGRLVDRQNAMENARVAVDMLAVNLQMSERFVIDIDASGNFHRLWVYQVRPVSPPCTQFSHENCVGCVHPYVFEYIRLSRRLNFGRQELASHIEAPILVFCEFAMLMHISITTADSLGEPFTIETWVDMRHRN